MFPGVRAEIIVDVAGPDCAAGFYVTAELGFGPAGRPLSHSAHASKSECLVVNSSRRSRLFDPPRIPFDPDPPARWPMARLQDLKAPAPAAPWRGPRPAGDRRRRSV